ncbi:MAG: DUF1549 domain-containing protein [Planctomycetaceae bacterium]|nr:DUF1549 domain-containing protein [Planctomycetaceae bacterium]
MASVFPALAGLLVGACYSASLFGEDHSPVPLVSTINEELAATLTKANQNPAPPAPATTYLRRVTYDLAGRPPSAAELTAFLADSSPESRRLLVDRLLASPDFPWHHANELDSWLMPRERSRNDWRDYLVNAARENRPWDQMFAEMLIGKEDNPAQAGALQFLKVRAKDLDALTDETSRIFFGIAVNCAKCHDHPLVDDWTQDHYYGLSRFFERTYLTKNNRLAEKPFGEVAFKTTAGEERKARFMFLTGATVEEPVVDWSAERKKEIEELIRKAQQDDQQSPPVAEFSPRMQLVDLALSPENRLFFARSIVNRTWARFFGRGLVMPLDQLHSSNPASHPALFDALTEDMIANGYDVKRLIRAIVLTDAYARGSAWLEESEPPPPELYAVAALRPMTPRQFAMGLLVAGQSPKAFSDQVQSANWPAVRHSFEGQSAGWASMFEQPGEHFQVSVDEALFFSNGTRIQNEVLRDAGNSLIGVLKTIAEPREAVRVAMLQILNREPADEELDYLAATIPAEGDVRIAALRNLVWSLVASPELRFNY